MGDTFVTSEKARSHFLLTIRSVFPEAFEELCLLVTEVQSYFPPNPASWEASYYSKVIRRVVYQSNEILDDSESNSEITSLRKQLLAIVSPWQERWHLNGKKEREWVSQRLLAMLYGWAIKPDLLLVLKSPVRLEKTQVPLLEFPAMHIEPQWEETWGEFSKRAKKGLSKALGQYKTSLKEFGEFKRKIEQPTIWLTKYQLGGLSWREIADSQNLDFDDTEPKDYNDIRKSASELANILPITLRK